MQRTQDQALILKVEPFGDHDAIVHFFSASHGAHRGVVKAGLSRKYRADIQPATLVAAAWQARLPEHLSRLSVADAYNFAAPVLHEPLRLAAVASAMGMLHTVLADGDPHPMLFTRSLEFLKHITSGSEMLLALSEYVRLELALLEETGFGLDLKQCAATGAMEDLVYVSPKSGRAVCRSAGMPYHERLLPLPNFLEGKNAATSLQEICQGLRLTSYFIEQKLLAGLHRKVPHLREHFVALANRYSVAAG